MTHKTMKRLTALLLALLLCAGTAIGALPVHAEDAPEKTDEEWIAEYHIPEGWARSALLFAVKNGLMNGKGSLGLCPTDRTTRAELATMLVRALGTTTGLDLSGYSDVTPGSWYAEPLGRAAALGMFMGDGQGHMNPGAQITREQAFTVISRAFGVTGGSEASLYGFKDWYRVSGWARTAMGSMVRAGFVNGNNGKLNPDGYITRAEIAQVLYNMLDGLGKQLPESFEGDYLLTADEVPADCTVDGDLLICGEGASLTLQNLRVTGRLVIQGVGPVEITVDGCDIGRLVLCRPAALLGDAGTVEANKPLTVKGSCTELEAHDDAVIEGTAGTVTVLSGTLTVAAGGSADALVLRGGSAVIDGTVATADVWIADAVLRGEGTVDTLRVHQSGVQADCTVLTREELPDAGLAGVSGAAQAHDEPTLSDPTVELKVAYTGVNEENMDGPRVCTVQWYDGDFPLYAQGDFALTDGAVAAATLDLTEYVQTVPAQYLELKVVLLYGDDRCETKLFVDLSDGIPYAAQHVRTQNVQAFAKNAFKLGGTYVAAGTQVSLLCTSESTKSLIRLDNGVQGWVDYGDLEYSWRSYYTTTHYSTAVKEYYVNHVRDISSRTKYMVWISLWTQEVNVFEGSRGNWTLLRSFPCATGVNTSPTPVESTRILYKTMRWEYDDFYVHHVTIFDQARAFHSIPVHYEDGSVYNGTLGRPASHGCVRVSIENAIWIYENLSTGTQVEIY